MMKKTLLFVALLSAAPPARATIGLAARFGDVVLENVEIGRTYNLRERARIPFGIQNRGDAEMEVYVEFISPSTNAVAANYEPIPDPTWLKAIPDRLRIGPGGIGFFDLLLTIPDDPALNGKHYQATVRAQSGAMGLLGLAVENRLRFSVGPGPETLREEKKRKKMSQLDFDVTPRKLFLKDVPAGKSYDVRRQQKKSIRIANYGPDELAMQLSSVAWETQLQLPDGYEAIPNPEWVTFKSSNVVVAGESIEQTQMLVNVPDEPQHRGKKYAALIKTGLSAGFWLDSPIQVFLEMKP